MARAGVKNELFDCLARRQLCAPNILLLGVNNAYPVIRPKSIAYYNANSESLWSYRLFRHYRSIKYQIKHRGQVVYSYIEGFSGEMSIKTPKLHYRFSESADVSMIYTGNTTIEIQRIMLNILKIQVTIRHMAIKRLLRLPSNVQEDWFGLYKYCYDLMVLINGGPL